MKNRSSNLLTYIRHIIEEDLEKIQDMGKDLAKNTRDLESISPQKVKDLYQQARIIKKLWQKEADISKWKSGVTFIHWAISDGALNLVMNARGKDEISVIPYTKKPWQVLDLGASKERIIGVIVSGHPTFAANADLNSNIWKKPGGKWEEEWEDIDADISDFLKRKKSTGFRKYPGPKLIDSALAWFENVILTPSDITPPEETVFDTFDVFDGISSGGWTEVLLANWKVLGIVIPDEMIELIKEDYELSIQEYIKMIIENGHFKEGIPVYDQRGKNLINKTNIKENALRAIIREMILKESGDGPEAHILNFYEDLDMPLEELKEAIQALLEGKVENVEEKMDGQNLTFTVKNGKVETFSKGVTWKRLQSPGVKVEDYEEKYAHIPSVRDAFTRSHKSLQIAVDKNPEVAERLFQNGKVVIEALTMIPENPNTIVYDSPTIRFVRPYAMDPELNGEYDKEAYRQFVEIAKNVKTPVSLGTVPILELKKVLNADEISKELMEKLGKLIEKTKTDPNGTIGDLVEGLVKEKLRKSGLPSGLIDKAAQRIGRKNKQVLSKKDAQQFGDGVWEKIQEIESGPFLDEAIIPLESILQRLATEVFRHAEFVLASNETESGQALRDFVKKVKNASQNSKLIADPKQTEAIRVALERIGDEEAFEKAVEGIVFRWKGKTRKLTGLFTPINKLRGFFAYGKEPARFNESKRKLSN